MTHPGLRLEGVTSSRVLRASSEAASSVASDAAGMVALVVTSPPYHNAISYTAHELDRHADYRARENLNYSGDYLALLSRVWDQCYAMLRPGGCLVVNVGTVLDRGYHYPLPHDVLTQVLGSENPWRFLRTIYWNKVTAGVKRAGSVIQHALPGYWYPNIMTEHILVFQKPGGDLVMNDDVPPEWWENVWDLAPVPPGSVDHPAPFPEDLPHRFIRMLTAPTDLVMDPFNGAGATTKAALDLGRSAIGFDISETYVAMAKAREGDGSSVRPRQLVVVPVSASAFVAPKSKGQTRHGAGISSKRRRARD